MSNLDYSKDKIIEDYNSGISADIISKEYDCSKQTILRFLRGNGVVIRSASCAVSKLSQQDIEQIRQLYLEGNSAYSLTSRFNVSRTTIEYHLKAAGFDISGGKHTREVPLKTFTQEIISDYQSGLGCTVLAKKYKTNETNIIALLRKNNIFIRYLNKYTVNDKFFEKIDTKEKAYILGLLYADGNIEENHRFRLSLIDQDLVEKVKNVLEYTGNIRVVKPQKPTRKIQYCLAINNVKMVNDLIRLGCHANKTYTLKFPDTTILPEHLIKSFVLGFFDGDGGFLKNGKNNKYYISFVGTDHMMTKISSHITNSTNINFHLINNYNNCMGINRIQFGGNLQILKFCNWLYQDAPIYMDRKYNRYMELKTLYGV